MGTNFFSLYNLTLGSCALFWAYFDTLSQIIINAVATLKENARVETHFLPEKILKRHILLKGFFYLSIIMAIFSYEINAVVFGLFGFLIGSYLARNNEVLTTLLINKNEEDFKKLIKYSNISFVSGIVYFSYVIIS